MKSILTWSFIDMSAQTNQLVSALKKYRSHDGVPREQVSHEVGVSVATIYRWEKGISSPTGLCRAALAKYLKKNGNHE